MRRTPTLPLVPAPVRFAVVLAAGMAAAAAFAFAPSGGAYSRSGVSHATREVPARAGRSATDAPPAAAGRVEVAEDRTGERQPGRVDRMPATSVDPVLPWRDALDTLANCPGPAEYADAEARLSWELTRCEPTPEHAERLRRAILDPAIPSASRAVLVDCAAQGPAGEAQVPAELLVSCLAGDTGPELRAAAARAAAGRSDVHTARALNDRIERDEDPCVRRAALEALARRSEREPGLRLVLENAGLASPHADLRAAVARTLARPGR